MPYFTNLFLLIFLYFYSLYLWTIDHKLSKIVFTKTILRWYWCCSQDKTSQTVDAI